MRIRLSNCKLVFALKTDLGSLRWNQVSLTFWFVQTARFGIKQLGYSRRRPPPQCVKKKKQRHNDKMHRSCGGALFTLYQITRRSPVILTFAFNVAGHQRDGQIAFLAVRGRTHSGVRMQPTASTRDKPKFTQIKVNSQSVFIRVHLWFKRSLSI